MIFELLYFITAIFSSVVAALAGFGIGSFLTPALSLQLSVKTAVAIVAIPHILATAARLIVLHKDLDMKVFLRFGLTSAFGGLLGAWIHSFLNAHWLSFALGVLLVLAGVMGVSEKKFRLHGFAAWIGGIFSGVFGGLVGNQGGVRAVSLLYFDLNKKAFVAVSTASALLVDLARMPFYFASSKKEILQNLPTILFLCIGVLIGTWIGMNFLKKVPEEKFKKIISYFLIILGLFMLAKGLAS